MPVFAYTARTLNGKVIDGHGTFKDEAAMRINLSAKGLETLECHTKSNEDGTSTGMNRALQNPFHRVTRSELRWVTGQMALMLSAGTTIAEALEALGEQLEGRKISQVLRAVLQGVNSGNPLSSSLGEHENIFGNFYISAVRSGENTGDLEDVFNRLEEHLKKRDQIMGRIRTALIYPTILMCIGILAVTVMLTFVIPKFIVVFGNFGAELPLATRMLMGTAAFTQTFWFPILALIIAVGGGTYWAFKNPLFRPQIDRAVLKWPVVGALIKSLQSAILLRTLGMLLKAGVPVVEALQVAEDACGNGQFKKTIRNITMGILQGDTFTSTFSKSPLFTPSTKQMVFTGEKTGSLSIVMERLADHLDEESDKSFTRLAALAEPLLIILMGAVIGSMAIALLSPLFQLTSAVRGGG
jgi:type II secretory pathway component PulF